MQNLEFRTLVISWIFLANKLTKKKKINYKLKQTEGNPLTQYSMTPVTGQVGPSGQVSQTYLATVTGQVSHLCQNDQTQIRIWGF